MWNAFISEVRRHSFAIRMFAYLIARSYLTIHRQQLEISKLNKRLKEDRIKMADFIEKGILHSEKECGSLCEPHIIVKFIRDLKD